jgi:hypothetical protein
MMKIWKKNKLVSDLHRYAYERVSGEPFPEERQSGRSLGRAFAIIGMAMQQPGKWFIIEDFYAEGEDRHRHRNVRMAETIRGIIHQNELQHFEVTANHNPPRIKYDVFEEVEVKTPSFRINIEDDDFEATYTLEKWVQK